MDFDKYFKAKFKDLHEAVCCGDLVAVNYKKAIKKGFKAGQKSKQAEIDALKARINEAKEEINSFFDNQTQKPTDREYCNKLADILELLK